MHIVPSMPHKNISDATIDKMNKREYKMQDVTLGNLNRLPNKFILSNKKVEINLKHFIVKN